jgi:uncharacterized protein (TIGR03435 family)
MASNNRPVTTRLLLAFSGVVAVAALLTIGALPAPRALAQSQPVTAPAFEVASVKPSQASGFRHVEMKFLPGGRFVATNFALQTLIAGAYHVPFQSPRLTGGPAWLRSDRYDVEAKAGEAAIPAGLPAEAKMARMRLMLQKLLADRFKLALHRETKELPVYALVAAKNGPKLPVAKIAEEDCFGAAATDSTGTALDPASCHALLGGQGLGLHGRAVDMSDLAVYVENFTDRPVVEKTGIHGLFQIETTAWVPLRQKTAEPGAKAEDGSDLASLPSLFTVFERLRLKLEPQRGLVEILVIDRVERPSEN